MKDSSYSQFCEALQKGDLAAVDSFAKHPFWTQLDSQEKERLGALILKGCEQKLRDTKIDAFPLDLEKRLLASFKLAEELSPAIFQAKFGLWQLWGNLLVALSLSTKEENYLEESLQKYAKAAEIAAHSSVDAHGWVSLNHDWGKAWVLLGKSSKEAADIQRGIEKFSKCVSNEAGFLMDFGEALAALGSLLGERGYFEEAKGKFKAALATFKDDSLVSNRKNPCSYLRPDLPDGQSAERVGSFKQQDKDGPKMGADFCDQTLDPDYSRAWILYAKSSKEAAELEGEVGEAEKIFQEAILAVPDYSELWLLWGELYVRLGWVRRDPGYIEQALEKLTALKVQECDPVRAALLLGEGLFLLGFFLEDMKLIKEGEEQLNEAPELDDEEAILASGLLSLCFGLYFSEEKYFKQAGRFFQKGVRRNCSSPYFWYGLFQSYVGWGELSCKKEMVRKGLSSIERVVELAPSAAHFWNSWGMALMKSGERGHVEKAISKFKKALSLKPDLEWQFNYGCALDRLASERGEEKLFEEAIAQISAVYKEAPYAHDVSYQLALVLSHHGELTMNVENLYQAADLFASFVKKDNDDDTAWVAWGYTLLILAVAFDDPISPQKGEELRSEAESKLLKAVAFGNGPANYHLACLYSLSGLYELSMDYLRRADANHALPQLDDLERDEWLAGVRKTEAFIEFVRFRKKG